jgi:hypothetical protein
LLPLQGKTLRPSRKNRKKQRCFGVVSLKMLFFDLSVGRALLLGVLKTPLHFLPLFMLDMLPFELCVVLIL